MKNDASSVLFRRLPYMLSPQIDIYENLPPFISRTNRVLEVGFGTGIGVLQYARSASHVTAIEIDPAAVRFAQRCFPLGNVWWQEGDITQYRFLATEGLGDTYYDYDFIVMIEVLEHIHDSAYAIDNVKAALKPGKNALITVPNKNRVRKKDDPLILHEWNAEEFLTELLGHFDDVRFLDYELHEYAEFPDTTATPLIVLCS